MSVKELLGEYYNNIYKNNLLRHYTNLDLILFSAFTKPVVGVFDLASNVTEGLKNTTSIDELNFSRVRYPRHIGKNKILKVNQ